MKAPPLGRKFIFVNAISIAESGQEFKAPQQGLLKAR